MTTTLVDSNVLLDIATDDPMWSAWSGQALADAAGDGQLMINALIYAEVSVGFPMIEDLDDYIGAHAAIVGCRLLTRDAKRYRTYFPDVEILAPLAQPGAAAGPVAGGRLPSRAFRKAAAIGAAEVAPKPPSSTRTAKAIGPR